MSFLVWSWTCFEVLETAYNITERYCWDFRTSAPYNWTLLLGFSDIGPVTSHLNLVDGDKQIEEKGFSCCICIRRILPFFWRCMLQMILQVNFSILVYVFCFVLYINISFIIRLISVHFLYPKSGCTIVKRYIQYLNYLGILKMKQLFFIIIIFLTITKVF